MIMLLYDKINIIRFSFRCFFLIISTCVQINNGRKLGRNLVNCDSAFFSLLREGLSQLKNSCSNSELHQFGIANEAHNELYIAN